MTTTDDEQLDRIKEFWGQYGTTIVMGITFGVVMLAGWFGWQNWQAQRHAQSALAFHQIEQLSAAHQPEQAMEAARKLAASDQGSVYATLALLLGAHEAMSQNDDAKAQIYLQDAMKSTTQPALAALARLRLARVQWAQNQPAAALATLQAPPPAAYMALYADLTGDIQASQKNWVAARAAYELALRDPATVGGLVQIKLDNLPAADATNAPSATEKPATELPVSGKPQS
ncbi:MAG TPA: tetratricopeptide repeat protein [Halothiobacillus sp.]|nr:tetratricopeptide repeat protein [Halothiobacillus sp.]